MERTSWSRGRCSKLRGLWSVTMTIVNYVFRQWPGATLPGNMTVKRICIPSVVHGHSVVLFCSIVFILWRKSCGIFYRPGACIRSSVSDQMCYFIEELYGAGEADNIWYFGNCTSATRLSLQQYLWYLGFSITAAHVELIAMQLSACCFVIV